MHKYKPLDEIIEKPSFVASWVGINHTDLNVVDINSPEAIGESAYNLLGIMRVYCFKNGTSEGDPLIFPKGQRVTVEDFARKLGLFNVKEAKIFGGKDVREGQLVSMDYSLNDGEKVNLRLK